jgi:prepilin peptidase CpaA
MMAAPHVIALVVALVGCVTDLRTRRIPNALTFSAAATAVVFHGIDAGLAGIGHSLAGLAVGLALFLPLFALRGLGGGDVKLLAALGAWMESGLSPEGV